MVTFFLIFSRKQDLTFRVNYLQWRQFAWNVKSCFFGGWKTRQIFQNIVCWTFYPECWVLNDWQTFQLLQRRPVSCNISLTCPVTTCLEDTSVLTDSSLSFWNGIFKLWMSITVNRESVKTKNIMANSVDPDEMAHHEPSHLDLHCLQRYLPRSAGLKCLWRLSARPRMCKRARKCPDMLMY